MSDSNDVFKDTASQAEAMLEQQGFYPEAPKAEPVAVETPAPVAQPAEARPTTPPAPLDVSPETPIKIKVNGEEKIVKASEYQEMLQRTDVFTQRQQAVAKQQRELEQYYAQKEAYLTQQAQAVQGLYQEMLQRGNQPQPESPKINPQEIATIGEVQQAMIALAQQFQQVRQQDQAGVQQALERERWEAREEFEIAQDQKRFTQEVQKVLNSPEGKLLAEITPKAEQILRFRPLEMGASTTDQAIEFLHQFAKEWAGTVQGRLAQQSTAAAVAQAKTVMEAPLVGHAPPAQTAPPKIALKKDGTIDWNALRARAEAIMETM
jgi:hypothetical protein